MYIYSECSVALKFDCFTCTARFLYYVSTNAVFGCHYNRVGLVIRQCKKLITVSDGQIINLLEPVFPAA